MRYFLDYLFALVKSWLLIGWCNILAFVIVVKAEIAEIFVVINDFGYIGSSWGFGVLLVTGLGKLLIVIIIIGFAFRFLCYPFLLFLFFFFFLNWLI